MNKKKSEILLLNIILTTKKSRRNKCQFSFVDELNLTSAK